MGGVPAVTAPVKMNVWPISAAGAKVKSAPETLTQAPAAVVVRWLLSAGMWTTTATSVPSPGVSGPTVDTTSVVQSLPDEAIVNVSTVLPVLVTCSV